MSHAWRAGSRLSSALLGVLLMTPSVSQTQEDRTLDCDGRVALHALMALSDAHLQKLSDVLTLLASTSEARSGNWNRIRPGLAGAAPITIPAVLWYAAPDGKYWTLHEGRVAAANLSDRPYFPRVLAGERIMGTLVVSRSTNRNTAIVAVPVKGANGSVVGVLGGSVHLDSLAALLRAELGGLDREHLFFALGEGGLGALNSDPTLIFTEPIKLGDAEMQRAFREILGSQHGTVTYSFRGTRRTVLYQKSPVTGWWYAFGTGRQ